MGNLPHLLAKVLIEIKAEAAPSRTPRKNVCFDFRIDSLAVSHMRVKISSSLPLGGMQKGEGTLQLQERRTADANHRHVSNSTKLQAGRPGMLEAGTLPAAS